MKICLKEEPCQIKPMSSHSYSSPLSPWPLEDYPPQTDAIHPQLQNPLYYRGSLSIIAVPLLFSFKKTYSYGYVLNGMLAIIGTILMAHFSIAHWPAQTTFASIMSVTLPDILILWS